MLFHFVFHLPFAFSVLTVRPNDTTARVGDIVTLYCSTNLSNPVYWSRKLVGEQYEEDIYDVNGIILPRFQVQDRFSFNTTSHPYNLIIQDVKVKDEAYYICTDNLGFDKDEKASAKLTVVEAIDVSTTSITTADDNMEVSSIKKSTVFLQFLISLAVLVALCCCRRCSGWISAITRCRKSRHPKAEPNLIDVEAGNHTSSDETAPLIQDQSDLEREIEDDNARNEDGEQTLLRNGKENMEIVFKMSAYVKVRKHIMSKAFLFRAHLGTKESSKPKPFAFNHLSTVCKDWWKTLERPTVLSVLKRPLHKLLNKPELETKLKSGVIWDVGEKVICITTLLENLYMVTESKRNVIQRCNLDSLEKLPEQQQTSGTSHQPTMHVAVRMTPEMIHMPKNVKISHMEASEKENGIFLTDENGNVWFWSKGSSRPPCMMKKFSPSKCMTVSITDPSGQSFDEMRIRLLPKDNILEIHSQNSAIINTIFLPPTVHNPTCVIRNSKGYIFVGHGDDKRSRICVINNNGAIVLTYGDKPEGHPDKLNEPSSMTLDGEDYIHVADSGNDRILVLNSKMHLIKVLLDKKYYGITNPRAVKYMQNMNRLIVSCDNSIHIYGQEKFDFAASSHAEDTEGTATSEEKKSK